MSTPNLSLRPCRPISTAFEAPEFVLLLENHSAADVPIRSDWFAGVQVDVVHPDGRREPLRPCGAHGPTDTRADDEMFDHTDREQRFSLRGALAPGAYVLEARLAWDPRLAASTAWTLEAPAPVAVVPPVVAGTPADPAWLLVPGAHQATLLAAPLRTNDVSDPAPASLGAPTRFAALDPRARGLTASAHADHADVRRHGRVAWLTGARTLGLGATAVLFDSVAVALPGPALRIVGPVLAPQGGACGLLVLADDDRRAWLLRGDPALVRQPPVDAVDPTVVTRIPPPAADDDATVVFRLPHDLSPAPGVDNAPRDMSPEPDDDFEPGADVPAPVLVATVPLPVAISHGAAALGPSRHTWLLAGDADGAIELVVLVVDAGFEPRATGRLRIDHARLIPGCDPCLHVDADGLARAALLFEATGAATPHVGLARLAFDDAARPVFLDGVERRRLQALDAAPIGGALQVADDWTVGWCVHTAGGQLVGAGPDQPTQTIVCTRPGARVLFVLAAETRLAVALAGDDGDVAFASL